MSRDIFVMHIPDEVTDLADVPEGGWPEQPLPFGADRVREVVLALVPDADFSDPEWGNVVLPGVDIEVNLTDRDPLTSFALHVRASDHVAADTLVRQLLRRLGARGFDTGGSGSGIIG